MENFILCEINVSEVRGKRFEKKKATQKKKNNSPNIIVTFFLYHYDDSCLKVIHALFIAMINF